MGVSGSGKSTVGALLAERLGWRFEDADSFHSPANIEKMRAGHPLTEADRRPWLQAVASRIAALRARGECVVVACSALKRAYRTALIGGRSDARLVFLAGAPDLLAARLARRTDHFMPASLLRSQFETLEPPGPEENPIIVSSVRTPEAIVDDIMIKLVT
jgi:gluconokinase